jgi:hypothetical protein
LQGIGTYRFIGFMVLGLMHDATPEHNTTKGARETALIETLSTSLELVSSMLKAAQVSDEKQRRASLFDIQDLLGSIRRLAGCVDSPIAWRVIDDGRAGLQSALDAIPLSKFRTIA